MPEKPHSHNFLGLEPPLSDYAQGRYAVMPIPYDRAASFGSGASRGPSAIIAASHHVELCDEEYFREYQSAGISTLDAIAPNASGPEAMCEDIFRAARRVIRDGKVLLGLGGDHSVTTGLVRATTSRFKKLSVLQIDAHSDLRDSFEQSRYSHACVMRRVVETGAHIVPVGIRCIAKEEHRVMRRLGIVPVTAARCRRDNDWIENVLESLHDSVYITIDIDGFDPAYAPGTGTPEPGGLDWYQVTQLISTVAAEKRVVAADIVEVSPIAGQVVTEFLAARLLYKLICCIEARR